MSVSLEYLISKGTILVAEAVSIFLGLSLYSLTSVDVLTNMKTATRANLSTSKSVQVTQSCCFGFPGQKPHSKGKYKSWQFQTSLEWWRGGRETFQGYPHMTIEL